MIDVYGASLSVFKSTPERQLAAWLFLKWLAEPEQQAKWSRGTNYFPTRKSVAAEPGVAAYDECRNEIGEMLNAVAAGEDVDKWLSETLNECNTILKEAAPQ